jgi:pentose-5-phosphate-3-epimerase
MAELIKYIHSDGIGLKAGVAINPETPVKVLYDALDSHERDSRLDFGTCS